MFSWFGFEIRSGCFGLRNLSRGITTYDFQTKSWKQIYVTMSLLSFITEYKMNFLSKSSIKHWYNDENNIFHTFLQMMWSYLLRQGHFNKSEICFDHFFGTQLVKLCGIFMLILNFLDITFSGTAISMMWTRNKAGPLGHRPWKWVQPVKGSLQGATWPVKIVCLTHVKHSETFSE